MKTTEWRFDVQLISSVAFAQYMDHRDVTVRGLAKTVERITGKKCSHQVIGHLRSGERNTCRPTTAKAIEKALGAPPGSLFVPRVSRVARDVAPTRRPEVKAS